MTKAIKAPWIAKKISKISISPICDGGKAMTSEARLNIFLTKIMKNSATLKKNYEKGNKAKIMRRKVNWAYVNLKASKSRISWGILLSCSFSYNLNVLLIPKIPILSQYDYFYSSYSDLNATRSKSQIYRSMSMWKLMNCVWKA